MPPFEFFRPKPLKHLSLDELEHYAEKCKSELADLSVLLARFEGVVEGIGDGLKREGFYIAGGVAIALLGTIGVIFTPASAALALVGGVLAVRPVPSYGNNVIRRHLIASEIKRLRDEISFRRREADRIQRELDRRGYPQ